MHRFLFVHQGWLAGRGLLRPRWAARGHALNIDALRVSLVVRSAGLQEWLPFLERHVAAEKQEHRAVPSRRGRKPPRTLTGFVRRTPAFAQIAGAACGHEVFPTIGSASGTRHNVIDVQISNREVLATV